MKNITVQLISFLLLFYITDLSAQSLSRIKSRKIKQVTVMETKVDKKGKETQKTIVKKYNRKGLLLEEATLRSDGTARKKVTYNYTKSGKIRVRRHFDDKDQVVREKRIEYHSLFDKPTKMEYLKKGKIYKVRAFEYDINGNRSREIAYNKHGETVREYMYTYDAKGMLTSQKAIDKSGVVEERGYSYVY